MTSYGGDMRFFNRFAYGFNNPYRFTDPDGRRAADEEDHIDSRSVFKHPTARNDSGAIATRNTTGGGGRSNSRQGGATGQNGANSALARAVQGSLGVTQIVGGFGQISSGGRICTMGYGAGCLAGGLIILHGVGNATDGVGEVANAFDGRDRKWNFVENLYINYVSKDYGHAIYTAVDTVMSGTALIRETRRYFNPATPFITGTVTRSAAAWSPAGTLIVDGSQAAKTFTEEASSDR